MMMCTHPACKLQLHKLERCMLWLEIWAHLIGCLSDDCTRNRCTNAAHILHARVDTTCVYTQGPSHHGLCSLMCAHTHTQGPSYHNLCSLMCSEGAKIPRAKFLWALEDQIEVCATSSCCYLMFSCQELIGPAVQK